MITSDRLRQIRLARGLSQDALVARMGGMITKAALSLYENGKAQPRPAVAAQLARALGVSGVDLSGTAELTVELLAFRRKSGMSKGTTETLKSRMGFALEERIKLRELIHPGFEGRFRFEPIPVSSLEDAERAAETIREKMGLGLDAIGNLTETLEGHGVFVVDLEAPEIFDGLSAHIKRRDIIVGAGIASRSGVCGERQRSTTSHEAGHVFIKTGLGVDEEKAAFRFGGAFLLPKETLFQEVGRTRRSVDRNELLALKRRYGISAQAILRRMIDLEIISPAYFKECCIWINRNGWRKSEPEPQAPETSLWFRQNVLRAHAEGLLTTHKAEEMIGEKIGGELPALTRLRALRELPLEERRRILREQTEAVAHLFNDDLAKPPHERELTAFTALDGIDSVEAGEGIGE